MDRGSSSVQKFVSALPKAELHLHLEGALPARLVNDLIRKHRIRIPTEQLDHLYLFDDMTSAFPLYHVICDAMRDARDFEEGTYEALARIAASGGRYAEMFFNPDAHVDTPYAVMLEGIVSGLRAAEMDYGVRARMVPSHNRQLGPASGRAFVAMVAANRIDDVIGIGLCHLENDPRAFAEMYADARRAGLHVTAHAGELGPAAYVRDALDILHAERIDHGYTVLDDEALVERCIAEGTFFTTCPTGTVVMTQWFDPASPDHPIRRMLERGLAITIGTDLPGMYQTTLNAEYLMVAERMGADFAQLGELSLNGIRASWMDPDEKRTTLAAWTAEIDALVADATV